MHRGPTDPPNPPNPPAPPARPPGDVPTCGPYRRLGGDCRFCPTTAALLAALEHGPRP